MTAPVLSKTRGILFLKAWARGGRLLQRAGMVNPHHLDEAPILVRVHRVPCGRWLSDETELRTRTTLPERLVKIGARVVSHGRYATFQMAEVAVPHRLFAAVLWLIGRLQGSPPAKVRGRSANDEARSDRRGAFWWEKDDKFQPHRAYRAHQAGDLPGSAAFGGAYAESNCHAGPDG
jgi:hypothetical protein